MSHYRYYMVRNITVADKNAAVDAGACSGTISGDTYDMLKYHGTHTFDTSPIDFYSHELTQQEAWGAMKLPVFNDYTGLNPSELNAAMEKVIRLDHDETIHLIDDLNAQYIDADLATRSAMNTVMQGFIDACELGNFNIVKDAIDAVDPTPDAVNVPQSVIDHMVDEVDEHLEKYPRAR